MEKPRFNIRKIHHVAYRCRDAKETVEWYRLHLGLDFVLAIAEDHVPSTQSPDPCMCVFLDAGGGNVLAFFELPHSPAMCRDMNTPEWVQHTALEVESVEVLDATKARLQAAGIAVVGVIHHTIFKGIHFVDPSGHRLELAANTGSPKMMKKLHAVKWDMLEECSQTRRVPRHATWLHEQALIA